MDGLIWPVMALFALAVVLRARKRRDRIDWRSRGLLALFAIAICVLFGMWIQSWRLNALEEANSFGGPAPTGPLMWIAGHYQSVLLPVYAAVLAVIIDLLSRLLAGTRSAPATDAPHGRALWRTLCANVLLFVAVPGALYAWTATFADSDSIMSDTARDVVMPVIATYGAPAYWLMDGHRHDNVRPREAQWPWSPRYRHHSRVGQVNFFYDASPWLALAIVLTLVTTFANKPDARRLVDYFVTPSATSASPLLHRIAFGPWRGRAALIFTTVWLGGVTLWCGLTRVILGLGYWLLGGAVVLVFGVLYWMISALLRRQRKERGTDQDRS